MNSYGSGRVSVITHGVQSIADHWEAVGQRLPGRTVVPNRRGRAGVPIGAGYDLKTEVADLHQVLNSVENPILIGHSYGGAIALLAAAERDDLAALVLYDPTIPVDGPVTGPSLRVIREALGSGDRDRAFTTVLTDVVGETPEGVEQFRTGDPQGWAAMLELIDSTCTELTALDDLAFDPALLERITVPTLVLLGEQSDRDDLVFGRSARTLAKGIPGATLVTLPGQGHVAHLADPELLVDEIKKVF